jgi:hypothetical protein
MTMPTSDDDSSSFYSGLTSNPGLTTNPTKRMTGGISDPVPKTVPYNLDEPKTRIYRGSGEPEGTAAIPPDDPMQDPFVGCLVVIEGRGRGASLKLGYGRNSIGRDKNERVSLNFGDEQISRSGHGFLTYDPRSRKFFLQGGTGPNLVYIDGEDIPVLTPVILKRGDKIILGGTKLMFWPFCGEDFDWHAAP